MADREAAHVNKDMRRLVRDAEQQGWTVSETRNGHFKFQAPDGEFTYIAASTPSEYRGNRNMLAALKRHGLSTRS